MKDFRIEQILQAIRTIDKACTSYVLAVGKGTFFVPNLSELFTKIATDCQAVDLVQTAMLANRFASETRIGAQDPNGLSQRIDELFGRFYDEISVAPRFFAVAPEKVKYLRSYDPLNTGGTLDLPKARTEIVSACRCFALEENTACVFHLMRALEDALQRLSANLDVNFESRNWGQILTDLQKKIDARIAADAELLSHLFAIKNAWRNPTMHVERDYNAEEAFDVLRTVRSFLISAAPKLKSAPKAVS